MSSDTGFTQFYTNNLLPSLTDFEHIRKKLVNIRWYIIGTSLALVGGAIALFTMPELDPLYFLVLLIPFGLLIYVSVLHYTNYKHYRTEFKNQIIERLVKHIDPSLHYDYTNRISTGEFLKSKIFLNRIDRANGEDYITGTLGKTQVEFSELHMEYKTESTDSKGRRQTQWHTIFKGVFFIADFNKNFKTETIVLNDNWEGILGRFARKIQKLNISRPKLIQLENPEFEKMFQVFGEDQIESRYILSPALMERLVNFRNKTNMKISLSFIDSKIYIAMPISKNLFEPRVWNTVLDFDFIQNQLYYLKLFTGIVEELNLNTRIWTKQD